MELTPWIWQQFTDSDGSALSAGKIYTYFSGTTVKATTYQDALGTTPNTNPIILEADGFAPGGQIFLPVGVVYSFLVTDSLGGTVKTIDDIEAKSAGTVTTDYTVMVDGSDPMPAYLGLKLSAGSNVTITPVTGGPNGTVLEIASTGGGGVTQWEVVTLGGADYLTPITGLPQKLYASDAMMAEKTVTAGAYRGLTARENYVRMDGENGTLGLNQSVTGSTNTGLYFGVNDSTQRAKIQATKNIGDPAKLEISALMTGTKTSSGWLALDADNCLTLATPSPSDVGAQPASTNLGSIASLADAVGWLKNSGTGVFSYTTPTAADVGAQPASTILGTFSALANAHGWLHNDGAGVLSYSTPTAADVGAIPVGGAVLSVTASGSSITVGGTPTNPTVAINLDNENSWTAPAKFSFPAASNRFGVVVNSAVSAASYGALLYDHKTSSETITAGFGCSMQYRAVVGSSSTITYLAQSKAQLDASGSSFIISTKNTGDTGLNDRFTVSTTGITVASTITAVTWSGNPTHSGNHTFSGNVTFGDASSDTLTVNATPTFNATTLTFGATTTINGGLIFGNTCTFNATPRISMTEPYLRLRDLGGSSGGATSGYIQWLNASDAEVAYIGRKSSGTSALHKWYNAAGDIEIEAAGNDITLKTNVTVSGLAGTGPRMVTASSTGLLATRLANSYIMQSLTASAAIALDTELLRMTGTGFTGTLTTSLGDKRLISFRNSGTGNLTIACAGAETIDGVATLLIPVGGVAKICSVAAGVWETVL